MIDPKKFEALRKELLAAKAAADEAGCAYRAATEAHDSSQRLLHKAEEALSDYWYECVHGEKPKKLTISNSGNLILGTGSSTDNIFIASGRWPLT